MSSSINKNTEIYSVKIYNSLNTYLLLDKNPTIETINLLKDQKNIFDAKTNTTPLMYYCNNTILENLNPEIIEYFSDQIGLKNDVEYTALNYYLAFNRYPSMKIIKMLEKEKDIFDNINTSNLMFYCGNKFIEKLDPEIIEYFYYQLDLKNCYNCSALFYYLEFNKNPSVEIIKLFKDEKNKIDNKTNTTHLMCYCENKNIEKLNPEIIEYFSEQIGKQNIYNNTALCHYLEYNKNHKIESIELLKDELDIKENTNNFTLLMHYCRNQYIENLDPEIVNYFSNQIGTIYNLVKCTALNIYMSFNKNPSIEIIEMLKDEINFCDESGDTALMYYCSNKNIKKIDLEIIEKLKDIKNTYNKINITPLMYYCSNNNTLEKIDPEIIKYFSNQIGKQDIKGNTALTRYLHFNKNPSIEIIELLKEEKNIKNVDGDTSLICYCSNEFIKKLDPEIIKYFSDQIGEKNNENKTALEYYLENNKNPNLEMIEILKDEIDLKNRNNIISYCKNKNIEKLDTEIMVKLNNRI